MNERKRLIEILKDNQGDNTYYITDEAVQKISEVLLKNGVVVLPCIVKVKRSEKSTWYWLTENGLAWLGRQLNITIKQER